MKDVFTGLVLLLLAGLVRGRPGNVTEYGVLVLLPLSGEWETRGRAQLAGIRAAVGERENAFTGVSYVDVRLEYVDTKVRLYEGHCTVTCTYLCVTVEGVVQ